MYFSLLMTRPKNCSYLRLIVSNPCCNTLLLEILSVHDIFNYYKSAFQILATVYIRSGFTHPRHLEATMAKEKMVHFNKSTSGLHYTTSNFHVVIFLIIHRDLLIGWKCWAQWMSAEYGTHSCTYVDLTLIFRPFCTLTVLYILSRWRSSIEAFTARKKYFRFIG